MESGDSELHVHLHTGYHQLLDDYVARSTFSGETGAGLLASTGLGHNGTGTQQEWDTTERDKTGLGHTGLEHNRTGIQRDGNTT